MKDYQKVINDFASEFPSVYAGIALGIIDGDSEQTHFVGFTNSDAEDPLTPDTIFEIGSVTKVFTSILLAKFSVDGKLNLDDSAASALPASVKLPGDGKSEITFRHLANHRSSLPRLPDNLDPDSVDFENPYLDYSIEDLYEYLNSVERVARIGWRETYSNLGTGLLGHLLGRIDESDYEQALTKHVLNPLELNDTTIQLSPSRLERLAQPHIVKDAPTKRWNFQDSTVAAGGIKSTLRDMMKFVKANLEPEKTPIGQAIRLTHEPMPTSSKHVHQRTWFGYVTAFIFSVIAFLIMFAFDVQPGWIGFAAVVLAPIFLASLLFGTGPMLVAMALIVFLTWQIHGKGFDLGTTVVMSLLVGFGARGGCRMFFPKKGKGRLAWNEMRIGKPEALWHNGMVGGSASFVAVIPEQNKGLVILTNTAVEVDTLGTQILHELAK